MKSCVEEVAGDVEQAKVGYVEVLEMEWYWLDHRDDEAWRDGCFECVGWLDQQ